MASKEVKNLLKAAKECMEKKEFETGVLHCKNALKIENKNYMAQVLLGACLQETNQTSEACLAFKRAASMSPDMPLAWKGLASFYEKQNQPDDRQELLRCYIQLLRLESDSTKFEEWARKIGVLLSLLVDKCLVTRAKVLLELPDEKRDVCINMLFSVVGSMEQDATEDMLPLIEQLLSIDWGENKKLYCTNIYKKYLKLLFKLRQLDKIMKTSKKLYDKYPDVVAGPEWFCKAYLESKFGTDDYTTEIPEPSEMYMTLLNMVPNSYLAYACKGVDELVCQVYVAACDSLTVAVTLKPTYAIAWYLLTQGQTWLHRFAEAEFSARQSLKHWKPTETNVQCINNCKFWLAKALSEQDVPAKCQEAIRIADEFTFDKNNCVDFLPILLKATVKVNDEERYEKYLKLAKEEPKLKTQCLLLEAFWAKHNGQEALRKDRLLEASEGSVDNFEVWLELAMFHYEQGSIKNALRCVLNSTKLNECCPVNFRLLGHIYKTLGDLTKARRCYQKAFELNSADFDAGIGLSDIYRILGKEDENLKLLTIATQVPGARWAWLKMGLHYLSVNNPAEAVSSLRVAVRFDASDRNVWESLGDAYLTLGSYSAASKSYQKVLELAPHLIYPRHQIATSKHLQGLHEEAVIDFRETLRDDPNYLPALKGHAVSCLALMRTRISKNMNDLAADSAQEAVTSLSTALKAKPDLICCWKLLGEACILINTLSSDYCKLKIPSTLWISNKENIDEDVELKNADILQLGVRSYCHALALNASIPDLWYDLAVCYNTLADSVTLEDAKKKARESALASVKYSLHLKNDASNYWNLLSVICMSRELKNLPLAQHALIKAISLDEWNAMSWSNLGTLYLTLGDLLLANQCFTEAQRCDPDYVQCWIGQAMLAEATNNTEAMDLFRHSAQLGFHPEGALGYASMVLTKIIHTVDKTDKEYIYSIQNMNAVLIACDSLTWYNDRYPNDACGLNMLGLLLERLRLYRTSSSTFSQALEALGSQDKKKDKVLLNYGRALSQLGRHEESVLKLKEIKEASFEGQCVLASAYLRAGLFEEAYTTYQGALETPSDEYKSHILVAMAGVIYKHQGHQDTKLLLMQACQLQPVSVAGLFACCSLGLLHSDLPLTELALQELAQYRDDPKHLANIALLQAYTALIKGQAIEAVRHLCSVAHRHPEDPQNWLNLGLLQLHLLSEGDAGAATRCFFKALCLGRSSIDVSKITSLVSLGYLSSGRGKESIRSAKKAVQLFPAVTDNWLVLIAARLAQTMNKSTARDVLWLKKTISLVKTSFEVSENAQIWLRNCESATNILSDKVLG